MIIEYQNHILFINKKPIQWYLAWLLLLGHTEIGYKVDPIRIWILKKLVKTFPKNSEIYHWFDNTDD